MFLTNYFGNNTWLSTILIAVLVFLLFWIISRIFTSRSKSIVDDFVVKIVSLHAFLLICLYSAYQFEKNRPQHLEPLTTFLILLALLNIIVMIIRLSKLIIPAASEYFWEHSDNRAMGFAIPLLVRSIALFGIFSVILYSIFLFFGLDGFQLSLSIIGAMSFLLAYIFQEPLQNLFGGVSLLTDAPFEYGDLIILDDNKTYRVDRTGSRVTQLYDIKEHTHAYVPNLSLGNQVIINITHPDTELREVVSLGVAYGSDMKEVSNTLLEIANAHPNILGAKLEKRDAAPFFSNPEIEGLERERIDCDALLREVSERFYTRISLVSEYARRAEAHGLSVNQRESLKEHISELQNNLSEISVVAAKWLRYEVFVDMIISIQISDDHKLVKSVKNILSDTKEMDKRLGASFLTNEQFSGDLILGSGLLASLVPFSRVLDDVSEQPTISVDEINIAIDGMENEISNMDAFDDIGRQFAMWRRRLQQVQRHLVKAFNCAEHAGADDYLVHSHLSNASNIVRDKFKMKVPGHQFPTVDVLEFGASTIDLRLEFFIDNIAGEHFKRRERVRTEVICKIENIFAEKGIEMPYPHIQIVR